MLVNWAGNRWGIPKGDGSGELVDLPPWRKTFDVKYWLTDFESSVQYAADSDPSTPLVQGVPIAVWGLTDQDYLKQLAPEALKPEPYCPFKSDVYQVGFCSLENFCASPPSSRSLITENRGSTDLRCGVAAL